MVPTIVAFVDLYPLILSPKRLPQAFDFLSQPPKSLPPIPVPTGLKVFLSSCLLRDLKASRFFFSPFY